MPSIKPAFDVDLAVIGTGMAGMSAALMAASRGLRVAIAGLTGEILFSSGLFDFLSVHPVTESLRWKSPWDAMERLKKEEPLHPYAGISLESMRGAWKELLSFLERKGLGYFRCEERNVQLITSQGTIKTSYCIPMTMTAGIHGLAENLPCLVLDIAGLRGFSAAQIVQNLQSCWPHLRPLKVIFPESNGSEELYPEIMARTMETAIVRQRLADRIGPHLGDAQMVGLPAILGIGGSAEVMAHLESLLGVPVFEIPGMPPSVPGIRLKETFERALPEMDVQSYFQHRVFRLEAEDSGFHLILGRMAPETSIRARAALLATGRFFGGGLIAERDRIRESLIGLPVAQPAERAQWHRPDFFDPLGHPVHRAGIEVDESFRPLGPSKKVFHPYLFASGSVLAHQDWIRSKAGVGIAICTSYAAVSNVWNALE